MIDGGEARTSDADHGKEPLSRSRQPMEGIDVRHFAIMKSSQSLRSQVTMSQRDAGQKLKLQTYFVS